MKKDKPAPTAKCLADFFRRFGRCQTLIDFAKITDSTEARWRLLEKVPSGENLLSVRYFLDICGYSVSELEQARPSVKEVGLCVALRCITLAELAGRLSMPHSKDFYCYFHGVHPSSKRVLIMDEIVEACRESRKKLEDDLRRCLSREVRDEVNGVTVEANTDLISSFSNACDQVRMLGNVLLNGGRAQRDEMRRRMGSGSEPPLHCTWEVLNNLLNEKTPNPKGKL